MGIAMDLFWRQGYEGTSTAQLTEAMGIAPPSLYAAFGSKDALYREAIARYQLEHGDYFVRALEAQTTARAAIEAVLLGAARQFTGAGHAPGCMVATAHVQSAAVNQGMVDELRAIRLGATAAMQQRLEAGIAAGELPASADAKLLASFFALVIQGMAVQAHDGADRIMLEQAAALAMQAWPAEETPV
ncbi:TetR/AcrR family transcriptional regulator [Chitinimonas sp.]|uniref:TetR/AcrR family transcriptional regulator n=1 Tax=Chitinimonas sp. TaxID=1934313 RepID=UPI0035ADE0FD